MTPTPDAWAGRGDILPKGKRGGDRTGPQQGRLLTSGPSPGGARSTRAGTRQTPDVTPGAFSALPEDRIPAKPPGKLQTNPTKHPSSHPQDRPGHKNRTG